MFDANAGGNDLIRLVGFTGICVGLAWALQIAGFDDHGSAFSRFLWVMAAASIAGAGAGLVMASSVLGARDRQPAEA